MAVDDPSLTVGSSTDRVGPSSFRMVPVAWPSAIVAFVGSERVTEKASCASATVSLQSVTLAVPLVER